MHQRTARALIALNNRFYAEHAASFSATRSAPWEGWRQALEAAREAGALEAPEPRVLDLACGNLRFERFLAHELAGARPRVIAVDNCDALAACDPAAPEHVSFHHVDILGELLEGAGSRCGVGEHGGGCGGCASPFSDSADRARPRLPLPAEGCDLAVCFGFMHHVPGRSLRESALAELICRTRPGGIAVVSLWRFMDDGRLARKAVATDELARSEAARLGFDPADLEPGDHFLGWQDDPAALRYCHHFDEREIDDLAHGASALAREVGRFSADGANHALNRYLVLQRVGRARSA